MYSEEVSDKKREVEFRFDRELDGFLKISSEIMKRKCSINEETICRDDEIENDNETLDCLKWFTEKIYKNRKIDIRDHIKGFERLYNLNKREILKTDITDEWIRDKNIYLQFGEGLIKLKKDDLKFRIKISEIYNASISNKKYTEEKMLDGDDDKVLDADLYRTENFVLKLMRLFYYIIDVPEDSSILEDIVRKFENDLNVPDNRRVVPKYKSKNGGSGGPDLVHEFTKRVKNIIQDNELPINLPENIDAIDNAALLNFADSFLQNPQAQNILKGIIGTVKGLDQNMIKNVTSEFMKEDGTVNLGSMKKITDSLYQGDISGIKNMASQIGINMSSEKFAEIGDQIKNFDTSSIQIPEQLLQSENE